MTMLHRHFSSLSLHTCTYLYLFPMSHTPHSNQLSSSCMTSKKSPLPRSSTKILDVMYANPFLPPLLFLKLYL